MYETGTKGGASVGDLALGMGHIRGLYGYVVAVYALFLLYHCIKHIVHHVALVSVSRM